MEVTDLKERGGGIWKGLEEGKRRKKCNYTTINKKDKHSLIFILVK